MRNPATFEWMLSNPEYRAQLEGMLAQQAGGAAASPALQELMSGVDMSPQKMNEQFAQLGMTPDQFIQKASSGRVGELVTQPEEHTRAPPPPGR
jgi:methylphosphotriester-DNA--protein-cysteine methyltransferase